MKKKKDSQTGRLTVSERNVNPRRLPEQAKQSRLYLIAVAENTLTLGGEKPEALVLSRILRAKPLI